MAATSTSRRGDSPVYRGAANFLVLLSMSLAVVACLAAAATPVAWPGRAATYAARQHRALRGHAVGSWNRSAGSGTPLQCAARCLRQSEARCRSFNYYRSTASGTGVRCQLNGATAREFPGSLVQDFDSTYYGVKVEGICADLPQLSCTSAQEPWQLVFKGVAGHGVGLFDMWTAATWNSTLMVGARNGGSTRDEALYGAWNRGELSVARVKLSLCSSTSDGSGAELVFTGTGSDVTKWFDRGRLLSSPWQDLSPSTATRFFSIYGHEALNRRFFVQQRYGHCGVDEGWLVVIDSERPACEWEQRFAEHRYPIIQYSKTGRSVIWDSTTEAGGDSVGRAGYLTIHIDAMPIE